MIRQEEVYRIGKFNKPHGVKGELLFTFTDDIFDRVDCDYLVCSVDGILVPFFIDEYRFKSDTTALMLLDGIDSVERARMFTNLEVYFPKKYIDHQQETDYSLEYFVGFEATDEKLGRLGVVSAIDDSTANALFCVEGSRGEVLIPAHDNLIKDVNAEKKTITFDLPEGLLTMNDEERH